MCFIFTAEKCASLDFASKEIAENAPEGKFYLLTPVIKVLLQFIRRYASNVS